MLTYGKYSVIIRIQTKKRNTLTIISHPFSKCETRNPLESWYEALKEHNPFTQTLCVWRIQDRQRRGRDS